LRPNIRGSGQSGAFVVLGLTTTGVLRMRKVDPVPAAASKALPSPGNADIAPVQLVCLALALSVLVLGWRIASIW